MMTPELKDAIKKSGNNLHVKVVKLLEERGWSVEMSAYYVDDTTTKPREIDIVAQRRIHLSRVFGTTHGKDFTVFLFIECKHFNSEVALWAQKNKRPAALRKFSSDMIGDVISSEHFHHYFTDLVAKLYTATERNDDMFDAITQPVKALVSYKDRGGRVLMNASITEIEKKAAEKLWLLREALYHLENAVGLRPPDPLVLGNIKSVKVIFEGVCRVLPPVRPAALSEAPPKSKNHSSVLSDEERDSSPLSSDSAG